MVSIPVSPSSSSCILTTTIVYLFDAFRTTETGSITIKINLFMPMRDIIVLITLFIYCLLFRLIASELFRCFKYLFNYLKYPTNPITLIRRLTRLNLIYFIRILSVLIILSSLLIIMNKLTFLLHVGYVDILIRIDRVLIWAKLWCIDFIGCAVAILILRCIYKCFNCVYNYLRTPINPITSKVPKVLIDLIDFITPITIITSVTLLVTVLLLNHRTPTNIIIPITILNAIIILTLIPFINPLNSITFVGLILLLCLIILLSLMSYINPFILIFYLGHTVFVTAILSITFMILIIMILLNTFC
jgi:hypothetical protein